MMRCLSIAALALGYQAATAAAVRCNHALLREVTDRYVAAQSTGNLTWLEPLLSDNATYLENGEVLPDWRSNSTLVAAPLRIDRSHSIYDHVQCAAFTDIIVTDPANPHVIGAQIWLDANAASANSTTAPWSNNTTTTPPSPPQLISKIDRIVTTPGDWLFNATGTLTYALRENWGTVPRARRDTRAALQAAADAYLDVFKNASVPVPWGAPCDRLEGGAYTGRGLPSDSCDVGVIQSYDMPNRRYVVDEAAGVVSVLLEFGSIGNAPDSHEFRVEGGKLRYIHTMTFCEKKPNCGYTFGPNGPTR